MFAQGEKNNKFVNNIQSQAPCIIWQKKKKNIEEFKKNSLI
jgi:hypothetical protein